MAQPYLYGNVEYRRSFSGAIRTTANIQQLPIPTDELRLLNMFTSGFD